MGDLPPKQRIRDSFDRAAVSYDAAAVLQRRVCDLLLAGFAPHPAPVRVLDAGCGTGYGAQVLSARWPAAQIVALDFAPAMLLRARREAELCVAADVECLPFTEGRFAAWWSNLTVQWCDLDRTFGEARRVLSPGGHVALSTLGPQTFKELREAFRGIDGHRHTLSFSEPEEVHEALRRAGFHHFDLQRKPIIIHYPDLKALLRAVKDIGANSVGQGARGSLFGREAWQRVQAAYEQFREPSGLPARYDVILVYATTP